MNVFDEMKDKEHEQVVYCYDRPSGLRAIIAIHNTVLGPALGGCRMLPYENEDLALKDALRLSCSCFYPWPVFPPALLPLRRNPPTDPPSPALPGTTPLFADRLSAVAPARAGNRDRNGRCGSGLSRARY